MGRGDSKHPEWELMYRKGLSVSKIADVCRWRVGTVSEYMRVHKSQDPSLAGDHEANYRKPAHISVGWMMKVAALEDFHEAHGHYPTPGDGSAEELNLSQWLRAQRRAFRLGKLTTEKIAVLDRLPAWKLSQRFMTDQVRWNLRLDQVKGFLDEQGRWPRYRCDDPHEKVLGVWVYVQRSEAFHQRMSPETIRRLDEVLSGWNTWNGRRSTTRSTDTPAEAPTS